MRRQAGPTLWATRHGLPGAPRPGHRLPSTAEARYVTARKLERFVAGRPRYDVLIRQPSYAVTLRHVEFHRIPASSTRRASPNFDERTGLARPDMIVLHYTGMQSGARRAAPAVRSHRPAFPRTTWCSKTARSCNCVPEEHARLARRRLVLGRRHRHQFALDRHRDLQSRPRFRLSGFPARQIAAVDRAVPATSSTRNIIRRKTSWRIPTSRRPQAGSRREISLEAAGAIRRRSLGRCRRRSI